MAVAGIGHFDGDAPGLAVGPLAARAQFAADFHQVLRDAQGVERHRGAVHAVALGDGGQVQVGAAFLQRRLPAGVQTHAAPAAALARGVDGGGRGRLEGALVRAEAPGVHQRPDGRVVGPAGILGERQRVVQHVEESGGQGLPAGAGLVVARDVGIRFPGTHLGHHLVQRGLDGLPRGGLGAPGRQGHARRPGGAHGRSGQRRRPGRHGAIGDARRGDRRAARGVGRRIRHAAAPA
ncbi:hypothetical protein D9M68_633010 [compost metagenome]